MSGARVSLAEQPTTAPLPQPEFGPEGSSPPLLPPTTLRPTITGRRWVASTGHPLATDAALRILAGGGNAIDAGVAAGICLNVLQPDWTNFGGVAPIMLRSGGEVFSIAGLGIWPRETDPALFHSRYGGQMPLGVLRTIVPAAAGAWLLALERFGSLPLATVLAPALELAEEGFAVYPMLATSLRSFAPVIGQWPSTAAIYCPDGRALDTGDWLQQPDLARTFRRLLEAEAGAGCAHAVDCAAGVRAARERFYRGDIAEEIVGFVRGQGGWLSRHDMAGFEPEVERPPSVRWRGWQVFACGPWCQGPVLLQALAMLAEDDLPALGQRASSASASGYVHLLAEVLNLAFADREAYFGDPRFVDVPLAGLLSPEYVRAQRRRVDPRRAFGRLPDPGDPWPYQGGLGRRAGPATVAAKRSGPRTTDTSYLCVVDAAGNAFSATPSDRLDWSPVIPGLGLVASPRGVQSRLDPGHPSAVGPGRRPRLTPQPALAQRDDGAVLAFGSPGGDMQTQAMLEVFLNQAAGASPQAAIEAPRFATLSHPNSFYPHTYAPGLLRLEGRFPPAVVAELEVRGHQVGLWADWDPEAGAVCLAQVEPGRDHQRLSAGADPRRMAYAGGC